MKAISEKMLRKFWRKLDGWLFDLESLDDRQAREDHRASGVFSFLVAASHEINSEGDFIERFNDLPPIGSLSPPDLVRAQDGSYERGLSAKGEAEFLCRYLSSFRPLWWHWVFYPIRSAKIVRISKVEVPLLHRAWLAESEEPHLKILEFGTLAPSDAVTGELRRAIVSLGIPAQRLSTACRSMALCGRGSDLHRRAPHPFLVRLCRLMRDLSVSVGGLSSAAAIQIMSSDAVGGLMMLVGLMGIAAPALLAACILHELGPKWQRSNHLLTRVHNVMGHT